MKSRLLVFVLVAACNLPSMLPFGGSAQQQVHSEKRETSGEEHSINGKRLDEPLPPTKPAKAERKAFGDTCEFNDECASGLCIVKGQRGPQVGFCSARCKSQWDCQKLGGGYMNDWECGDASNTSQNVCLPNRH